MSKVEFLMISMPQKDWEAQQSELRQARARNAELERALNGEWREMSDTPQPYVSVIVSDLRPESPASSRIAVQGVAFVDDVGQWCIMRNGEKQPFLLTNLKLLWKHWQWPDALAKPAQPEDSNAR